MAQRAKITKQHRILREIYQIGKNVSVEELVKATEMSRSEIYTGIRSLKRRGLIKTEYKFFNAAHKHPPIKELIIKMRESSMGRIIKLVR